jgi:DNA-binding response OmpR family regulator
VGEGLALLEERESVRLVVLEAGLHGDAGPAAAVLRSVRDDLRVLLAGEPNGAGEADTVGVVSRPFAPVELVAAVRAALGHRAASADSR